MSTNTSDSTPPKRPLSAYNLYYRYKRAKIIEVNSGGSDNNSCTTKKAICQLIECPAGLENHPSAVRGMIPPDRVDDIRRKNIRLAMNGGQLFSKDNKNRLHRKSTHGYKMTFVEVRYHAGTSLFSSLNIGLDSFSFEIILKCHICLALYDQMNKTMVGSWKVADKFAKAVFKELADEAREEYQRRLNKHKHFTLLGIMRTNSRSEESYNLKGPMLDYSISRKEYPASSDAKYLPPTAKSSLRSSELQSPWDPFPFENQKLVPTSSDRSAFKTLPVVKPNLRLLVEKFYQPKRQIALPSQDPPLVLCSPCDPALVTPMTTGNPLVFSVPVKTIKSNAGKSKEAAASDDSGFENTKLSAHKHNVSVEDFMELIATLDESL